MFNIIHDCDETYNYLEPLHYLVHGSGLQTWEYGAQYALRAYAYLLLHWPAAAAPALLLGTAKGAWGSDGVRRWGRDAPSAACPPPERSVLVPPYNCRKAGRLLPPQSDAGPGIRRHRAVALQV